MGEWTPSAAWYRGAADAGRDRRRPLAAVSVLPGVAARARGSPSRIDALCRASARRSRATGWSSGSGTASARSSSNAAATCISGRAARSSSPIASPRSSTRPRRCRTAPCSTARCSRSADDRPLPFSALQQRIGRQKQVARKARDVPVVFMAYDVLEHDGRDIRLGAAVGPASAPRGRCRSAARVAVATAAPSWTGSARPRASRCCHSRTTTDGRPADAASPSPAASRPRSRCATGTTCRGCAATRARTASKG